MDLVPAHGQQVGHQGQAGGIGYFGQWAKWLGFAYQHREKIKGVAKIGWQAAKKGINYIKKKALPAPEKKAVEVSTPNVQGGGYRRTYFFLPKRYASKYIKKSRTKPTIYCGRVPACSCANPCGGCVAQVKRNATMGKYRKKRRYKKNWKASLIKKLNYRTGGLLGREVKHHAQHALETVIGDTSACANGEIQPSSGKLCLNGVPQGSSHAQRLGNRMWMKDILIQGYVISRAASHASVGHPVVPMFVALVLDTQTNGATINSEDVYKVAESGVSTETFGCTLPYRNQHNVDRFKVLWRKTIAFPQPTIHYDNALSTTRQLAVFKKFVIRKKLNLQVLFKDSGDSVTSIADNSLHLIAFAGDGSGGDFSITYQSRMRFIG
jgi:hypothetical protein